MRIVCPVLENNLFKEHKDIRYKTSVKSAKKSGFKKANKIRNNTHKVIKIVQPTVTLGEFLNTAIANYVPSDVLPLNDKTIYSALLRWGLVNTRAASHDELKSKRLKARENASMCKEVLKVCTHKKNDYQDTEDYESRKESNLQVLVDEYEDEQLEKPDNRVSEKVLALWVILKKAEEIRAERLEQEKEERKLQHRADKYFNKIKATNNRFAKKIEYERTDLQDLYDLSKNNMRVVVNFVNNNNKGL